MFKRRIIEVQGEDIVGRFEAGDKPEAIALALGISRSTVFRAIQSRPRGNNRRRFRSPGFELALDACGGKIVELARRLGIVPQSVSYWHDEIPMRWVLEVEKVTGVPREKLRPDFFERETG